MRAVKILLLSCLYPLVLFFAIGYTFSYTSPHASTKDVSESKGINLHEVSFLSPNPTTIILQEDTMDFVSASGTAEVVEQVDNKATASADLVKESVNTSSVSANALAEDSETQSKISPTPTESVVFPTISLAPQVQPGSVSSKSVTIIDSAASSVVVPQSSTLIIEDNQVIQRDTCTDTTSC